MSEISDAQKRLLMVTHVPYVLSSVLLAVNVGLIVAYKPSGAALGFGVGFAVFLGSNVAIWLVRYADALRADR